MKKSNIEQLRKSLPQVFTHKLSSLPEGLITRESNLDSDLDVFERSLIEDLEPLNPPDFEEVRAKSAPSLEPAIDREEASRTAIDGLSGSHGPNGDLLEPFNEIGADGEFPGVPRPTTHGSIPPVDALAFYLPFHRFSPSVYGIYLIADGVKWLTRTLFFGSRKFLTPRESLVLAKAFLFHHEAYHNAVEIFATRMELAHRGPVYETGARQWFQSLPSKQHEEALATGYAIDRARLSLPKHKRQFAVELLKDFVLTTPQPYWFGSQVYKASSLRPNQNALQEEVLTLSTPNIRRLASSSTWNAGLLLMSPSLARGKRFSYVVRKGSPLAHRMPLGSLYFANRKKLIKNLRAALGGGSEIAGGRHPIFLAPDGTRTPIPYGKDVDEGTLGSILKQLGIPARPRDFMSAKFK
jgi:hypothetical protein